MRRWCHVLGAVWLTTGQPPTTEIVRPSDGGVRFEANVGQWDDGVRFAARTSGGTWWITDDGVTAGGVTLAIVGAASQAVVGRTELATRSNFFTGSDRTTWRTNVPNYGAVLVRGALPGVDVLWHGNEDGTLEYDLEVAAGVDASAIELRFDGASVVGRPDGSLQIGTLVEKAPIVTQGDHELTARYVLEADDRVRLDIAGYRPNEPVLVDPVLSYSTYVGGSNDDQGNGIAVDGSGNVYVAGFTDSTNFPTQNPAQVANAGGRDAVVFKIGAGGSGLVYSTYLGGAGTDEANGIAVDSSGNAYVAGSTTSTDFPVASAFQTVNKCTGCGTAFVAKLDAAGSALVYSTYLGGSGGEVATHVALDGSGDAYVVGTTQSTDFPTLFPVQSASKGSGDAFVTKLDAAGSALVFSTYLGGSGSDDAFGIAVDTSGFAYVAGATTSTDFPAIAAFQATNAGASDAFIAKLGGSGSVMPYATYLGGSGVDGASSIAIDSSGAAYITGSTTSAGFPIRNAFQTAYNGGSTGTAFVSKLGPLGSTLPYSTFLGGSSGDTGLSIAVDVGGAAFVTGLTSSPTFPTFDSLQATYAGGGDAFVTMLSASGAALGYSTFLGGTGLDTGVAIALDTSGNAYVTGATSSTNFPTQAPLQALDNGLSDVFVTAIAAVLPLGVPCGESGECTSGQCVDGECCSTACTGECEACDVAGHVGTCTPVKGSPHGGRQACQTNGACVAACDGTNTTQCTYAPNVCASTCTGGSETDSTCDATGNCGNPTSHTCNGGVCATPSACQTTCTSNFECPTGLACVNGTCQATVCVDDHTSKDPGGVVTDCTPYKCGPPFGLCATSCASDGDCVAPATCVTSTGQCVTVSSGGCSCDEAPNESGPWLVTLFAAGAAALFARSRRSRAPRDSSRAR